MLHEECNYVANKFNLKLNEFKYIEQQLHLLEEVMRDLNNINLINFNIILDQIGVFYNENSTFYDIDINEYNYIKEKLTKIFLIYSEKYNRSNPYEFYYTYYYFFKKYYKTKIPEFFQNIKNDYIETKLYDKENIYYLYNCISNYKKNQRSKIAEIMLILVAYPNSNSTNKTDNKIVFYFSEYINNLNNMSIEGYIEEELLKYIDETIEYYKDSTDIIVEKFFQTLILNTPTKKRLPKWIAFDIFYRKNKYYLYISFLADLSVFCKSETIVIVPTPPGTGVI